MRDADQCPGIVEQIDEQKDEDDRHEADIKGAAQIERQEGRREARRQVTTPAKDEMPSRMPAIAAPRMAMIIAPGTASRSSATITRKPAQANRVAGFFRLPRVTRVSGLAATIPASFSAMMPRKRPIPAEIAIFCDKGMASTIQERIRVRLRIRNNTPEMNTAPSATCQL